MKVSQFYEFIDKIDIKKEQIIIKFEEILSMVFKDVQVNFIELQNDAPQI